MTKFVVLRIDVEEKPMDCVSVISIHDSKEDAERHITWCKRQDLAGLYEQPVNDDMSDANVEAVFELEVSRGYLVHYEVADAPFLGDA